MATTPPFVPGSIPGIGSGGSTPVPGIPQQGAPQGDPSAAVSDKTKQILTALLQASQRKQMANTAVPAQVPGQQDPNAARQIGMNTANPRGWGLQRFAAGLSTNIKNAVAKQKQDQVLKAEGDWSYLQSSLNELYTAQQSGDQQAIKAAQMKVDATLGDPKKLKNMAKALNQDWLNPEKTTVYGEALKKVSAKVGQDEKQQQAKQQAAQGLKGMIQNLLKQKQQLQLTVEQQHKMAQEILAKAPTTTGAMDKESAGAMRDELKAALKEEEDARKDTAKQKEDERKEAAKAAEAEQKQTWQKEEAEMKERYQRQRDQMQNQFHQTMETMRERSAEQRQNSHDMMMMKALGMKLDAQQEKLFKPDPTKLNKEVTDSVGTLKQQLAQAQSALKSLKTSASNHWIMGPGKDEMSEAEGNIETLQKAISHIEKNRDAIVKGKADLGDVVNKAYDIMGGGGGADDVPGFKPDKKN